MDQTGQEKAVNSFFAAENEIKESFFRKLGRFVVKVFLLILETVLLTAFILYAAMYILAKGPSPAISRIFVTSVRETSAVGGFLFFTGRNRRDRVRQGNRGICSDGHIALHRERDRVRGEGGRSAGGRVGPGRRGRRRDHRRSGQRRRLFRLYDGRARSFARHRGKRTVHVRQTRLYGRGICPPF